MSAEPRAVDLDNEPRELVEAAGLMCLAIDGLGEMLEHSAPGTWVTEALQFGARLVHGRAERVAAALDQRSTRWMTGLPEAYRSAVPAEARP